MLCKNCTLPQIKRYLDSRAVMQIQRVIPSWTRFKYALCTRAQANALSNDTGKR